MDISSQQPVLFAERQEVFHGDLLGKNQYLNPWSPTCLRCSFGPRCVEPL